MICEKEKKSNFLPYVSNNSSSNVLIREAKCKEKKQPKVIEME